MRTESVWRATRQKRSTMKSKKGVSAVSEALLALGVIVVSVMFVLVASNIVSFQTERATLAGQRSLPENIANLVEVMRSMDGEVYYTYRPERDVYRLDVTQGAFLTIQTPGQSANYSEFISEPIQIENGYIENSDSICIKKQSSGYVLKGSECE